MLLYSMFKYFSISCLQESFKINKNKNLMTYIILYFFFISKSLTQFKFLFFQKLNNKHLLNTY